MGVFIYFYLLFICLYLLMFYIGEIIVERFPNSKFTEIWKRHICGDDPDER